jgi:hypothetical protein
MHFTFRFVVAVSLLVVVACDDGIQEPGEGTSIETLFITAVGARSMA